MTTVMVPRDGRLLHAGSRRPEVGEASLSRRQTVVVAPVGRTDAATRPLITARRPRPLEIPEGFLRVCVLASRRQRPPGRRAYDRPEPLCTAACSLQERCG